MTPEEKMQAISKTALTPITDTSFSAEEKEERATAAMQISIDSQRAIDDGIAGSKQDLQDQAGFINAVTSNEFWFQDLPRSAITTTKNLIAQTVGFPSDMASLLVSASTLHLPEMAGEENPNRPDLFEEFSDPRFVLLPGNSEQIAEKIGGDPNHPSWLPIGLVSPGPGELLAAGKALTIGGIAASRVGGRT